MVELSQATGARIAGWYAVPKGSVGAAVWSSVAVAGGSVFATTGNSATRKTQTGYPDSIVSLSADGLKRTGSWTVPRAAQLVDGDFGASPTTFTGAIGGRPVAIVSACNKNGRLYVLRAADLSAGPVWSFKLASAAVAGTHHCLAGNVFDGGHLIAGAAATSIQGVSYLGSVREFDASTGAVIWQTGLPAEVLGTPALDGGGVLAAPTMDPSTGASNAVYLLDASDGTILAQLPTGADGEFAQPIFADGHLFLATLDQGLTSYSPS